MQLVVMLSAQRNHKQVVCLCTHSTLPVANQVVGVVSLLVTADARLGLNPSRVFLIHPAATLRFKHERLRRLRVYLHRHYLFRFLLYQLLSG